MGTVSRYFEYTLPFIAVSNRFSCPQGPFYYSTSCRSSSIFREAKLECRDRDKNTPLLISAKKNHVNAVKFLLKHGADPSAKDKNDRNVYHYTALEGCIDTLKVVKYHRLLHWLDNPVTTLLT